MAKIETYSDKEKSIIAKAATAAAGLLLFSDEEIGALSGVEPGQVAAWRAGDISMTPDTAQRLVDFIGIYVALAGIMAGDPPRCAIWMGSPNKVFEGQPAKEIMLSDPKTNLPRVREYLEAVLFG
jgi:preprotein translocase subunit Sec61beta